MGEKMERGNVQYPFLDMLRKERVPVALFLISGIKLQGEIESFDDAVVVLRNENKRGDHAVLQHASADCDNATMRQMIFKHAISTVLPLHPVRAPDEV